MKAIMTHVDDLKLLLDKNSSTIRKCILRIKTLHTALQITFEDNHWVLSNEEEKSTQFIDIDDLMTAISHECNSHFVLEVTGDDLDEIIYEQTSEVINTDPIQFVTSISLMLEFMPELIDCLISALQAKKITTMSLPFGLIYPLLPLAEFLDYSLFFLTVLGLESISNYLASCTSVPIGRVFDLIENEEGDLPLMQAVKKGDQKSIIQLILLGANPDAVSYTHLTLPTILRV